MTMGEFLRFLQKHCENRIKTGPSTSLAERDQSYAYEDIKGFIDSFLKENARQKALTQKVGEDAVVAIETDARQQFHDPVGLIAHLQKIAMRPPFFDDARISLLTISAFCNDFMNAHNMREHKEAVKQAPF